MNKPHSFQGLHGINRETSFWLKVTILSDDDCWEWKGWKTSTGYGMFWIGDRDVGAHRYSYQLHYGEIPEGLLVCHKCDNPICVNPKHLFLGTYQDNEDDKVAKNRQAKGKNNGLSGSKHWNSKLTEEQVIKIRELYSSGKYLQREIGEMFGIRGSLVSRIVNRERWAWLD